MKGKTCCSLLPHIESGSMDNHTTSSYMLYIELCRYLNKDFFQGEPDDILFPDSIQTSTSSSGCECFEDTYVVKKTITALQYPNEVVQVQANIGQLSPLVIGDVNFTAGNGIFNK